MATAGTERARKDRPRPSSEGALLFVVIVVVVLFLATTLFLRHPAVGLFGAALGPEAGQARDTSPR